MSFKYAFVKKFNFKQFLLLRNSVSSLNKQSLKIWLKVKHTEKNNLKNSKRYTKNFKKNLRPLYLDGVQLSPGYRGTISRQEILVLIRSTSEWWKAELTLESHSLVLNPGPLNWESSALTTRLLLHISFALPACFQQIFSRLIPFQLH